MLASTPLLLVVLLLLVLLLVMLVVVVGVVRITITAVVMIVTIIILVAAAAAAAAVVVEELRTCSDSAGMPQRMPAIESRERLHSTVRGAKVISTNILKELDAVPEND